MMKTPKQYFYEFLMIFLAVTLGFLSENLRENISDRKREREYIQSLMVDLRIDSGNLSKYIQMLEKRITYLDSLMILIRQPNGQTKSANLYTYSIKGVLMLGRADRFKPTEATLRLLENEGFNIIRDRAVIDSIIFYHNFAQRTSLHYDYMFERNIDLIEDMTEVLDFSVVNEIWDSAGELKEGLFSSHIKPLQLLPKTNLNDYKKTFILLNRLENQKRITQRSLYNHKVTLSITDRCIKFLQNE